MTVVFTNFFGGAFFGGGFFGPGVETQVGGGGSHPSQGYKGHEVRQRTKKEIREERERLGILPKQVERIVQEVAQRQVERLELDKHKQFEELSRELDLKGIEVESRFIEALNRERERLIEIEIGVRLKSKLQDEKDVISLLSLAAQIAYLHFF